MVHSDWVVSPGDNETIECGALPYSSGQYMIAVHAHCINAIATPVSQISTGHVFRASLLALRR